MLKKIGFPWLIAAMLALPLSVLAAGSAELVGDDGGTMRLEWLDGNTMRMDSDDDEGYIVFRDGSTYVVTLEDGQPHVMEISGMAQAFGEMAREEGELGDVKVAATDEKATVAGISGKVYRLTTTDGKGESETVDAVLTDDALVVEMTRAYFGGMGASMGVGDDFLQALPKGARGVLRIEDAFEVMSISKGAPVASRFELPAEPVDMGEMMKQLMQGAGG